MNASSNTNWQSHSSSALNQEQPTNAYIDLRTMKVIPSHDAHICDAPTPGVTFGVFDNSEAFDDALRTTTTMSDILFTEDTIPLTDTQKQVVQTLLSRRSVLYMSAAGDEKDAIVLDIVMRNRLWKQCAIFCAASRRSAEAMYALLCAQLGPDRRSEVVLDLGEGTMDPLVDCSTNGVRVIVTCPHVLRRDLVTGETGTWIEKASIVFIDSLTGSSIDDWEEILLGLPSRMLLCAFSNEVTGSDRDLLPLWLESIHNSVVAISPPGASSLHDRIERPQSFPLLRTFAFNAALHEAPVQVSLTLLRDILQKEEEDKSGAFVPKYEECFLHGITMIPAENTKDLEFRTVEEAEYADLASLVVADAKRTEAQVLAMNKKRARATTKRRERTPSSRAAARRRREAIYSESMLLPAIALTKGRTETENAAFAIRSALGEDLGLLWDEDSKDHVEDLVMAYKANREGQFCDSDLDVLESVLSGIGIVHDGCTPAVRLFVEELYRGGLIPLVVADTHLGSKELLALACAKTVLIESSALAICDDRDKGLIMASTAAALAGRMGRDDVGNLIVLWYDEAVDDEAAGGEIASTLLHPLFTSLSLFGATGGMSPFQNSEQTQISPRTGSSIEASSSTLFSSYDGVLRSLRRFGIDGYEFILDYTLDSYRGWLKRAALRATLEKLSMEKKAMDERIETEDWDSIADHERRAAKANEAGRVFKAMEQKFTSVVAERIREELMATTPGRIIGVESSKEPEALPYLEQKLLAGDVLQETDENPDTSELSRSSKIDKAEESRGLGSKERLSAAVFVAVRDQEIEGSRVKSLKHRWLVVCILADGMWTMVPMTDVVALSREEEIVVPNVDLLAAPHPATFDVDPSCEWAKCCPVDESEKTAVYRISDELISRVASQNRTLLVRYQVPEFEAQRNRLQQVQDLYQQSPWYGRETEVNELRRLRRKAAEMGDEILLMQRKENNLEERRFNERGLQGSRQSSVVAVLEDCHALSILGDQAIEMTPIGALGSVLPGRYPLFTAACLTLIDDVQNLSTSEFAAFVTVITCSGRLWTLTTNSNVEASESESQRLEEEDEELDLTLLHQGALSGETSEEDGAAPTVEGLSEILPFETTEAINEIMEALQQLHRRHQTGPELGEAPEASEIVPKLLNFRLGRAVGMFSSGASWREVADELKQENGYAVSQLRNTKSVLAMIATNQDHMEFTDEIRELATATYKTLDRWPVQDRETVFELIEGGVVEKLWGGNTYEKWWRGARDQVAELNGAGRQQMDEEFQSVEAEILD